MLQRMRERERGGGEEGERARIRAITNRRIVDDERAYDLTSVRVSLCLPINYLSSVDSRWPMEFLRDDSGDRFPAPLGIFGEFASRHVSNIDYVLARCVLSLSV